MVSPVTTILVGCAITRYLLGNTTPRDASGNGRVYRDDLAPELQNEAPRGR
jgi:hypothetical protein